MNLYCGIIGLPNIGKSTIFNALTSQGAEAANYPFCTVTPNIGKIPIPDKRLEQVAQVANSPDITPADIEFVDIAGLVKGASKGEGLGNQFLSQVREMDVLIHVVRCFEDDNISHIHAEISPIKDIDTVNLELIFKDLETIENKLNKTEKMLKTNKEIYQEELEVLNYVSHQLENGVKVSQLDLTQRQLEILKPLSLLTQKPVLYLANVSEEDLSENKQSLQVKQLKNYVEKLGSPFITISAQIEADLEELTSEDKCEIMKDLDIDNICLNRLVPKLYQLLNLVTFFTANDNEARSWLIEYGTKAKQAAGKIHSDMERGFIKAGVIHWENLINKGSFARARDDGKLRMEGKDYIVQDGEVINFKFNI